MQNRHNYLCSRYFFTLVLVNWYTAPIVFNSNRVIKVYHHINCIAVSCKGLVNSIIYNLKDHMMKPRAIISISNVHAWSFSYSIKAFKDLNIRGIIRAIGLLFTFFFYHCVGALMSVYAGSRKETILYQN